MTRAGFVTLQCDRDLCNLLHRALTFSGDAQAVYNL